MELQKAKAKFSGQGTEVVAASVQDLNTSRQMAQRLGVDIPILSDSGTGVTRSPDNALAVDQPEGMSREGAHAGGQVAFAESP